MAFNLRSPGLPVGQSPFSQKLKPGEGVLKTEKAKLTKSQESFIEDPSGLGKLTKSTEEAPKPKITGKIGSDLRRQQYKKYNLKDDATTKRAKAKTVGTLKAKGVKDVVAKKPKDFRSADKPAEKKAPKLAAKRAPKKELSKMEARKTKKINKKLSQAAEARASGNEKKALRKERAAARKTRRIATLNARKAKRSAKK